MAPGDYRLRSQGGRPVRLARPVRRGLSGRRCERRHHVTFVEPAYACAFERSRVHKDILGTVGGRDEPETPAPPKGFTVPVTRMVKKPFRRVRENRLIRATWPVRQRVF